MRYLSSARGGLGESRQEQVAVVVKVADERRRAPGVEHALLDLRHGGRRLGRVDRDADHLRPGLRQLDALRAVAAASAVSVIVMLWTTTGAPPPTWTGPTRTPIVL